MNKRHVALWPSLDEFQGKVSFALTEGTVEFWLKSILGKFTSSEKQNFGGKGRKYITHQIWGWV